MDRRRLLDAANSVVWFLMDGAWMSKLDVLAAVLAAPTVLTGIALLFVKREQSDRWIDLAINCWILMNVSWMCSEIAHADWLLVPAKVFLFLGVSAIAAFFLRGTDRRALSAFRRMRLRRP
jgi:hypothetical protein